jgi:hypothetical protein
MKLFCFGVLLALPLFGQKVLTDEDVLRLAQTGVPQGVIISAIAEAPHVQFNSITWGYLTALTNGGVSDDVVRAMAARTYGRPIPGYKPSPKDAVSHAPEMGSSNDKVTAASSLQATEGSSPTPQPAAPEAVRPRNISTAGEQPTFPARVKSPMLSAHGDDVKKHHKLAVGMIFGGAAVIALGAVAFTRGCPAMERGAVYCGESWLQQNKSTVGGSAIGVGAGMVASGVVLLRK